MNAKRYIGQTVWVWETQNPKLKFNMAYSIQSGLEIICKWFTLKINIPDYLY